MYGTLLWPTSGSKQAARQGRVEYQKVPGQINPADLFTKALEEKTMLGHAERIGQVSLGGRAQTAPCRRGVEEGGSHRA